MAPLPTTSSSLCRPPGALLRAGRVGGEEVASRGTDGGTHLYSGTGLKVSCGAWHPGDQATPLAVGGRVGSNAPAPLPPRPQGRAASGYHGKLMGVPTREGTGPKASRVGAVAANSHHRTFPEHWYKELLAVGVCLGPQSPVPLW